MWWPCYWCHCAATWRYERCSTGDCALLASLTKRIVSGFGRVVQAYDTPHPNQHVVRMLNLSKAVAGTICNVPLDLVRGHGTCYVVAHGLTQLWMRGRWWTLRWPSSLGRLSQWKPKSPALRSPTITRANGLSAHSTWRTNTTRAFTAVRRQRCMSGCGLVWTAL